jgi:hypothetical protein
MITIQDTDDNTCPTSTLIDVCNGAMSFLFARDSVGNFTQQSMLW